MPYLVKDKILFLSSASKILSSSLDYHVTLVSIGKMIVDSIADFCTIDILEDGQLQRVVVKMHDHKKNIEAQKFYEFPSDPKNKNATYETIKLGRPIIIRNVSDKWINSVSKIKEEKELMKYFNFSSFMFVPLHSRGQVIGVMTIGSTEKNFSYSEEDAIFIQELADRAAITVDKAMLFTKAQEAIRLRDEFLSIASHELKTPLTSILLSLQLVLKKIKKSTTQIDASDELISAIEIGIEQSKRMSKLINDLLNVSLASTDYFQIDSGRVDLNKLILDIQKKFDVILKNKKIKLKIEIGGNFYGVWDKVRIEQVVSNLISNAIKYGEGKPILLKVEKENKSVIISVADKGIGIKDEDKKHIFEIFNRSSDVRSYKGIGVGLFISKKIIEAHGGELDVKSKIGKGSIFIIKLPLSRK